MINLLSDIGFYFLKKTLKFNSLLRANNNFWNTDKKWEQRNELAAQGPQMQENCEVDASWVRGGYTIDWHRTDW